MNQRRYPGAKPFTRAQAPLFYGREADIAQLQQLVSLESLVVLYGKSGLGKSSLLNAGLRPQLEQDDHNQTLSLRFQAWTPEATESPLEKVADQLQSLPQSGQVLDRLGATGNTLWYHAKAWQMAQPAGKLLLIFDQFEELFSYPAEQIQAFKVQLAELLRGQLPDRYEQLLDQVTEARPDLLSAAEENLLDRPLPVRILFSIRSDRMHLLDQLSDYLPQVLKNNYELQALTEADARRALVAPAAMAGSGYAAAPFDYSPAAQDKILAFLRDDDHGRVEAIQLQILCTTFENRATTEGLRHFSVAELGDLQGIIDNYYHTQLSRIPEERDRSAAARLLEEGLVDKIRQQRLTLHESQIASIYSVSPLLLDQLVNSSLLRREPDRRQGYTYELSHDTLITPALAARKEREATEAKALAAQQAQELAAEKKKRRRLVWLSVAMGILALASIIGGVIAYQQTQVAQIATAEAKTQEKIAIAARTQAESDKEVADKATLQAELDRDRASSAEERATIALTQAEAQRLLAEAEAAKGRLLEETLVSENAFEYLLAEGHRFFGAGDFRNARTYWANARFVQPDKPGFKQLLEAATLGEQAEEDFLNGRFTTAENTYAKTLRLSDKIKIDARHIVQRQVEIVQNLAAWEEIIAGRPLQTIDTLVIRDNDALISLPESFYELSNLQSLVIRDNDALIGLPESLGELSNLQSLEISFNRALIGLPESLGELSNLQSLKIYNNEALLSLPSKIGQLSNLQSLEIYNNAQLRSLPEAIGQLRKLNRLMVTRIEDLVSNDRIDGILQPIDTLWIVYNASLISLPESLGELSNLQSLRISSNAALISLPESLGQLSNLQSLLIADNASLISLPSTIGELSNLQSLRISSNASLISLPESLGELSNLQSLRISSNAALISLPESLGQLSNLQSLLIADNASLISLPSTIGELSNLQSLRISSNASLISLPESLGELSNLQSLRISSNASLISLPESLGQLSNLQSLRIHFNKALISLPESLGQLSNLHSLEISYSPKLNSIPKSLLQLKDSLKELNMRETDISVEEVQYWKGVLPNTRITSDYD